jgi:hypothetical protein
MTMALADRAPVHLPESVSPPPKRDRRPLHYRVGTVMRVGIARLDLACLDGRVVPIRLAERTLYTFSGERLSGPQVLRPGVEVRVATVDSSQGAIAVLVECLTHAPRALPPVQQAVVRVQAR